MTEEILGQLAIIVVLGIGAQWLAWRLKLPSILLLLFFGLLAGPIAFAAGLHEAFSHLLFPIDPEHIFGDLLFPIVSLSVAVILFEGGLTLRFSELKGFERDTLRLIAIGVPVTWLLSTLAAHFILQLDLRLAVLFGAILVVTGPTVIMPLLRQIRPIGKVGPLTRWEGIVADPIGAILAVLVFEALLAGSVGEATLGASWGAIKSAYIGITIGLLGAGLIVVLFSRHWVPDYLENPIALAVVVAAFAISNHFQHESGLLTVTLMGIVLANQHFVDVKHIIEFKENLRVLLISVLFIILSARITPEDLQVLLDPRSLLFLGVMILLVRPIAVGLSTFRSTLNIKERAFLSWMAPRGIVAAAVTSLFALKLVDAGYAGAEKLVPYIFLIIIGTVAIYGLTASPLARRLDLAKPNPQGILFVSANKWARQIAKAIHDEGFPVLIVDSNWNNLAEARMEGIPTHYANILSESTLEELELGGIGRMLALTSNDEINALASLHFAELFGRKQVFQLSLTEEKGHAAPKHLYGRFLFQEGVTHAHLARRFRSNFEIKRTPITEEFDYESYQSEYDNRAIMLFVISDKNQTLHISTIDKPLTPQPGDVLIGLVPVAEDERIPKELDTPA